MYYVCVCVYVNQLIMFSCIQDGKRKELMMSKIIQLASE